MPKPLTPLESTLIPAAVSIINAVPRFSPTRSPTDHTCASAVLSSTGRIFTGVNSSHFTGGPCAENNAFGNATMAGVGSAFSPGVVGEGGEGERLVAVVAVLSDGRGVISPCGRCRQVMWDMHPWIRVIVQDGEEMKTVGMEELLPYAYSWVWKPKVEVERSEVRK
ncbi:related to cytidine deaminase [Phialocephala subalpina]|uniref:Related to cytidine deaminase n=1 Tax=Phialocephala subalpina TaxID=576137 RepID=A0A1L7WQ20_9HELO|nr:related to cytidine deaminase [Phialocephala subalpina]